MPPKLFKIKKAEENEVHDTDDLLMSDYQQSLLDSQIKKAEVTQTEEIRKAMAVAESGTSSTVVKDKDDEKNNSSKRTVQRTATSSGPRSAPTYAHSQMGFSVPDTLPVNTMDSVLGAPAAEENFYQPMLLNPVASDNSKAEKSEGVTVRSGTAFLEEGSRELKASYAANKLFFEQRANQNDSPTSNDDDAFMLLQLPRPVREMAPSCSIDLMSPGRVGKLTVYKSGRTTMTIGGAVMDVSLEPRRSSDVTSEGISQYAVAIDSNDLARRGCYQLCRIPRKVVCTPQLTCDE